MKHFCYFQTFYAFKNHNIFMYTFFICSHIIRHWIGPILESDCEFWMQISAETKIISILLYSINLSSMSEGRDSWKFLVEYNDVIFTDANIRWFNWNDDAKCPLFLVDAHSSVRSWRDRKHGAYVGKSCDLISALRRSRRDEVLKSAPIHRECSQLQ